MSPDTQKGRILRGSLSIGIGISCTVFWIELDMVAGAKDVLTTDDQSSACRMRWQNAQSSPVWPAVGRSRSVATLYERNFRGGQRLEGALQGS